MNKVLLVTFFLISQVVSAGQIEQRIQEYELSNTCQKHLAKYNQKVIKYKSIPESERTFPERAKLRYYEDQLDKWIEYCLNDE